MSNLSGSQYEIVAEFTPDASTKEVGFKLRVGKSADQETIVKYNTQTEEVTLDRSKSESHQVQINSYKLIVKKWVKHLTVRFNYKFL